MLTPEYLVSVADDVIDIYSEVEQDIINDIVRRIVKTGKLTETAKWQLERAQAFGYFRQDVEKTLASATGKSQKEIRRIMAEAGAKSLAYDDSIYLKAGLKPIPFSKSPALQAMLLQGTSNVNALVSNFTKTTAISSQTAFIRVLDRAYIQILTGAFDPTTAIKKGINDLAKNGINKVAYPSGTSCTIEAAVRRAVITGLNQSVSKLQLERVKEMEWDLVEVTSHAGARPTHAVWQGKIYCVNGSTRHYGNLEEETGYGEGDGLCGWNCYHNFYPYLDGYSTPTFSNDPSADAGRGNDEDYEIQQKQRYYERQVRAAKRECEAYNTAVEEADDEGLAREMYKSFQSASVKLKNREAKLKQFVADNGIARYPEREWIGKWDRSVSGKAVWANRKARK